MSVLISSERFGDVVCEESATLSFPRGLLGFEEDTPEHQRNYAEIIAHQFTAVAGSHDLLELDGPLHQR